MKLRTGCSKKRSYPCASWNGQKSIVATIFLFFNDQKCAGHYQNLEQAHELHCLSVTDGLVCVYIRKILNQSF